MQGVDVLANYEPIPEAGCWLWLGGTLKGGYGQTRLGSAHRVFYEAHKGKIPKGLLVCHKCDTPLCVNPSHLFLGTHKDNHADRGKKGRTAALEKHGRAKLTKDEVREIRASSGVSMRELAARFGVSDSSIGFILSGTTWRNLT